MLSRWIFFRSAESLFGNVAVLAFLCAQACDGVLTYIGLAVLGPHMEGNPLIAALMASVGAGPALASVKLMAGTLGCVLHLFGAHRLLAVLTLIYLAAAVVPWTALLWGGI
jgi:uncharacterized membrane protein